ncbi:MAG: TrkA family potassium uptake protein [Clostridia bacterium]
MDIKEKSHFAVIGLGRFGTALTKELFSMGKYVMAIDKKENKINDIADFSTHAAIADGSEEEALRTLGIRNFDAVIICMGGNMQGSILATLACKEIGVPYIVCKAQNDKHQIVLNKLGADLVIVPEEEMAKKMAVQLVTPKLHDIMELTSDYTIIETGVPSVWVGKTLAELNLRNKYGVNLLLMRRGADVNVTPGGDSRLENDDVLLVGGLNSDIRKFNEKVSNFD